MQVSLARLGEGERSHLPYREVKVLEERAKLKLAQDADAATGDTDLSSVSALLREEGQKLKGAPRLKRKRAKAPNPLAQMKKKKSSGGTIQQAAGKGGAIDEEVKKRKRQRHRTRHKKSGDDQVAP